MQDYDLLLTSETMTRIDAAAQEEFGISGLVLMENAGRALWEAIPDLRTAPAVFCAGPGNNGGDALVAARWAYLAGIQFSVITSRRELNESAAVQWRILERLGVERIVWTEAPRRCREVLAGAAIVVEGIAGTGISGPLREEPASLVSEINTLTAPVVAVDVPSGARDGYRSGEPLVTATVTVVTGYRKRCLYTAAVRPAAGEIRQVDPGFPPDLIRRYSGLPRVIEGTPVPVGKLPPLSPDGYKGTRGRLGVIGGAPGTAGAVTLAALGGLYGGAGMARICNGAMSGGVATVTSDPALSADPAIMVDPDSSEHRRNLINWSDVVVVGPGWTGAGDADLLEVLREAAHRSTPVVLDAAALRLLGQGGGGDAREFLRERARPGDGASAIILTPHPGELAFLAGETAQEVSSEPWRIMEELSRELHACVVLKGAVTIVHDPERGVVVIDGRCPALGTAGSGDVLAGLIGTWAVRIGSAGEAARIAATLHLNAGRTLADCRGWFTATDLAAAIGREEMRAREAR